jgi:hypothetical protein
MIFWLGSLVADYSIAIPKAGGGWNIGLQLSTAKKN